MGSAHRSFVPCLAALSVVTITLAASLRAAPPTEWARAELASIVAFYQALHSHPELSFREKETAARLAAALRDTGAEVHEGIGGHGVVGLIRNGPGKCVMLRTDLDALPVEEETGLPYASKVRVKNEAGVEVGVMHACGHDVHIANLAAVTRYLGSHKDSWQGTLMVIGQPAEERGAGAKAMLSDGLFERFPKPDFAVALHVDPTLETGKVACREGFVLANVDSVDITVRGRGGHGAYPHMTVDPIVQAAHLVVDLQSVVSREIAPTEPAVITVGSIHGGTKHNVIGSDCHLQLTVRSYSDTVRAQLLDAIQRKAKAVATGAKAPPPTVRVSDGTPALFNEPALVERLEPVFRQLLGAENVLKAKPQMGGEDFSRYGRAGVPIVMFRLGSVSAERLASYTQAGQTPPSLHSARFYPDAPEALATGVAVLSSAALELFNH